MTAGSYVLNHPAVFPGSPRLSISRNLIANLVASQTWVETRSPTTHFTVAVLESTEYFRLILKLRERRGDRLRYLWRLVWTLGVGDVAAVRLPEALFP
jgi:hypothetical protein